ncbi:MAG TPA: lanthionine synthetase C family protein [Candidatus Eisenbacteria bacterium]|nr:lanthionine synthetase C family protein [Candidatus Eisenbacteria bacterium]
MRDPEMATTVAWKPILAGEAAANAEKSVLEIAEGFREEAWSPERVLHSLSGGSSGLAIFYHELAQRWPESGFDALRDRYWNAAIDSLANSQYPIPNLYSGFTGVGWATAFLSPEDPAETGADDAHEELEEALLESLKSVRDPADYDLINGPSGWGLYALERWPHPRAIRALELTVDFFEQRAERVSEGIRWHTAPQLLPEWQREQSPNGYYNMGLSHGMPGVWVLLAHTFVRGIRPRASQELLEGSVRWGLAQKWSGDNPTAFPSMVNEEPATPPAVRLAWCYGDLGVASALHLAGQLTQRADWMEEAVSIVRRASTLTHEVSRNVDCGLCHGTAGVAHVFNRFYHATGEEAFAKAAAYWIGVTLDMRVDGIGPGRYAAWRHEPTPGWHAMAGLLEGSSGIGLALLTAIGRREPSWDRFLYISSVPMANR